MSGGHFTDCGYDYYKVAQYKAKITSMSMSVDATKLFAKTISFEVMVADWTT